MPAKDMRESTSAIPIKFQGLHPRCLPFMLRRENRKMDYLKNLPVKK